MPDFEPTVIEDLDNSEVESRYNEILRTSRDSTSKELSSFPRLPVFYKRSGKASKGYYGNEVKTKNERHEEIIWKELEDDYNRLNSDDYRAKIHLVNDYAKHLMLNNKRLEYNSAIKRVLNKIGDMFGIQEKNSLITIITGANKGV